MSALHRLYVDQMFPIEVTLRLRDAGHDAVRTGEVGQARSDDAEILLWAIKEGRVLITLDEHFGNWVVLPLSRHPGVIRVKASPPAVENVCRILLPFLRQHGQAEFRDRLVILSATRQRWIRTWTPPAL